MQHQIILNCIARQEFLHASKLNIVSLHLQERHNVMHVSVSVLLLSFCDALQKTLHCILLKIISVVVIQRFHHFLCG